MNLMPYDELNTFKAMVTEYKTAPLTNDKQARLRLDIEDYIEFLLIEAYVYGNVQAMQDLGILDKDPADLIDPDVMEQTINERIADKTFKQRIEEYLDDENSTVDDFQRVAETDATRVYNAGVVDGGKASGVPGVRKQWITMDDDRVRSTHEPLNNLEVPLDSKFVTWDGDSAPYPGLFSDPANNVNCRCLVQLVK